MIKKFLLGLIAILMVYSILSWAGAKIFDFSSDQVKSIYYSGIIATGNIVLSFLIIYFTINRDQKTFMRIFFSGMAARMVIMLALIVGIIKYVKSDEIVFIVSLFFLYFLLQLWEIVIINTQFRRG